MCILYNQETCKWNIGRIRAFEALGFFFFFALRGYVYSDAQTYYQNFFYESNIFDWKEYEIDISRYSFEPGFVLLTKLVKTFTQDYIAFQFVNSCVDFFLLDKFFSRYKEYYAFAFLCFFAFGGCMIEINLLRNFKAILLFFIALQYIEKRDVKKYLLCVLIAASFHLSALCYIPLYWILNKKIPSFILFLIFISGLLFPIFKIDLVRFLEANILFQGIRFSNYLEISHSYSLGIRLIERVIICYAVIKLYHREEFSDRTILFNNYILYYFFFNTLSTYSVFPERVATLFLPSQWILIPLMIQTRNSKNRAILQFCLILYATLIVHVSNNNATCQYTNVLFGKQSYEEYIYKYQKALYEIYKK